MTDHTPKADTPDVQPLQSSGEASTRKTLNDGAKEITSKGGRVRTFELTKDTPTPFVRPGISTGIGLPPKRPSEPDHDAGKGSAPSGT